MNFPPIHSIEEEAWKSTYRYLPPQIRRELLALREQCRKALSEYELQSSGLDVPLQGVKTVQILRLRKLDSALALHKVLPNEILTYIFALAHENDLYRVFTKFTEDGVVPAFEKSTCLEHVCSSWRTIALNTPALWRRVGFDFCSLQDIDWDLDEYDWEPVMEVVKMVPGIIGRGVQHLELDLTRLFEKDEDLFKELIIKSIGLIAHNLTFLSVSCHQATDDHFGAFLAVLPPLPRLKKLIFNFTHDDADPENEILLGSSMFPTSLTVYFVQPFAHL
jgi:hypothetical protein